MRKLFIGLITLLIGFAARAESFMPNFICHYVKTEERTSAFPLAFYSAQEGSDGQSNFALGGIGMAGSLDGYRFCSSMIDDENSHVLHQALYKNVPEDSYLDSSTCELSGAGEEVSRLKTVLQPGSYHGLTVPGDLNSLLIYHYAPTADELLKLEKSGDQEEFENHLMKVCLRLVPGSEPAPIEGRQTILEKTRFKFSR